MLRLRSQRHSMLEFRTRRAISFRRLCPSHFVLLTLSSSRCPPHVVLLTLSSSRCPPHFVLRTLSLHFVERPNDPRSKASDKVRRTSEGTVGGKVAREL